MPSAQSDRRCELPKRAFCLRDCSGLCGDAIPPGLARCTALEQLDLRGSGLSAADAPERVHAVTQRD